MTTYQLRDICYRERIINGIHAPLDKDVLIREILRFRGRADRLFITQDSEEGLERLSSLLSTAKLNLVSTALQGCAKLIVYGGISVEYFDHYTIGYHKELADTNALLVSGGEICAIFNLRTYESDPEKLFITKSAELTCRESTIRNYTLYCMDRKQSDLLYHIYQGDATIVPEHLTFRTVSVLNFEVRTLLESRMPLASGRRNCLFIVASLIENTPPPFPFSNQEIGQLTAENAVVGVQFFHILNNFLFTAETANVQRLTDGIPLRTPGIEVPVSALGQIDLPVAFLAGNGQRQLQAACP